MGEAQRTPSHVLGRCQEHVASSILGVPTRDRIGQRVANFQSVCWQKRHKVVTMADNKNTKFDIIYRFRKNPTPEEKDLFQFPGKEPLQTWSREELLKQLEDWSFDVEEFVVLLGLRGLQDDLVALVSHAASVLDKTEQEAQERGARQKRARSPTAKGEHTTNKAAKVSVHARSPSRYDNNNRSARKFSHVTA